MAKILSFLRFFLHPVALTIDLMVLLMWLAIGLIGTPASSGRPYTWTTPAALLVVLLTLFLLGRWAGRLAERERARKIRDAEIARANAVQKVGLLMDYALLDRLYQAAEAQPEQQEPPVAPAEDLALPANTELTLPAGDPVDWRPRIGTTVIHKGYITNGADEHPAMITRVHGVGEGALVNVTVFPDMQSPKVYASIPVYTSRKAAREAVVGQSRANGYAYRDE